MTVKELIKELEKFPLELPVSISLGQVDCETCGDFILDLEAREITVKDATGAPCPRVVLTDTPNG